jgi:hypothetical protein
MFKQKIFTENEEGINRLCLKIKYCSITVEDGEAIHECHILTPSSYIFIALFALSQK